jgi:phenylalanine-4-hydroxylase
VTYQEEVLFDPSWGVYDMAVGKSVVSAFAGPADDKSFKNIHKKSQVSTQKIQYSEAEMALHKEYAVLRSWRQNAPETPLSSEALSDFWMRNKDKYPKEWLLFLELLELMNSIDHSMRNEVQSTLEALRSHKEMEQLINNGLKLLS